MKDETLSVIVGIVIILFTILFTIGIIYGEYTIEEIDIPYWPETPQPMPEPSYMYADSGMTYWEWDSDSIMDNLQMDCGE